MESRFSHPGNTSWVKHKTKGGAAGISQEEI